MTRLAVLVFLVASAGCVPAERQANDRATAERPKSMPPARAKLGTADFTAGEPEPAPNQEPGALPVLQNLLKDDFDRDTLGDDYFATSDLYHLERGRLCVKGARNHPLWLRHRLPVNARIQVEAEAGTDDGDLKLEAWGDGHAAATRVSYTDATSYLAIFGGWKNRYHVLARMDEHAVDRPEVVIEPGSDDPRAQAVVARHRYRLKLERSDGRTVRFWVDDVELLSFADPQPLRGPGHDHFAFNAWETPVCFDHLVVEPLPS